MIDLSLCKLKQKAGLLAKLCGHGLSARKAEERADYLLKKLATLEASNPSEKFRIGLCKPTMTYEVQNLDSKNWICLHGKNKKGVINA